MAFEAEIRKSSVEKHLLSNLLLRPFTVELKQIERRALKKAVKRKKGRRKYFSCKKCGKNIIIIIICYMRVNEAASWLRAQYNNFTHPHY